jgi:hypothetical protein
MCCAVVHNAGSQAELIPQRSIGEIHAVALDHAFQNHRIQPVKFCFGCLSPSAITKAHGAKFDGLAIAVARLPQPVPIIAAREPSLC